MKHKPIPSYPEGDMLLKEWREQEIEERTLESALEKPSLLDELSDISIPSVNQGFEGGFKIESEKKEDN